MSDPTMDFWHEQIEKIHKQAVDQINADMLHMYIDDQDEAINVLEGVIAQMKHDWHVDGAELKIQMEAAKQTIIARNERIEELEEESLGIKIGEYTLSNPKGEEGWVWLDRDGEGMGISNDDIFQLFDKHFDDNF